MGNHKAGGASDLARGAVLQCVEAATLGMPFEVWKTRMGRQETILRGCSSMGIPSKWGGFLAGAGGGVCQTVVMGPCTFAVTALVNGEKGLRLGDTMKHAFKTQGIRGGALSTWNQPFEVARIQMQSAAADGLPRRNIIYVFREIVKKEGPAALLQGIVPRIGLAVWQTLFMVSGAKLIGDMLPW
ncbi:hypothetical protein Emed_003490 [Eimeria media]